MVGAISMPQGKGNQMHNDRSYEEHGQAMPKHINKAKISENEIILNIPLQKAYDDIFGDSLKEYNAKQKRSDRKIDNYLNHIKKSKNGEKIFYEDIIQWGDKDIFDNHPEFRVIAKDCLRQYVHDWQERNPALRLIGAYIHMDEASPHLHLDYIPVAEGYQKGLSKRNSLDKAMRSMGFEGISKRDNATKAWKENERNYFAGICRKRGLKVKEETPSNRPRIETDEFKRQMDQVRSLKETNIQLEEKKQKQEFIYNLTSRMLEDSKKQIEYNNKKAKKVLESTNRKAEELVYDSRQKKFSLEQEIKQLRNEKDSLKETYEFEKQYIYNPEELKKEYKAIKKNISDLQDEKKRLTAEMDILNIQINEKQSLLNKLTESIKKTLSGIFNGFLENVKQTVKYTNQEPPKFDHAENQLNKGISKAKKCISEELPGEIQKPAGKIIDNVAEQTQTLINRRRRGR